MVMHAYAVRWCLREQVCVRYKCTGSDSTRIGARPLLETLGAAMF
jgi:hypothetical protein